MADFDRLWAQKYKEMRGVSKSIYLIYLIIFIELHITSSPCILLYLLTAIKPHIGKTNKMYLSTKKNAKIKGKKTFT